ncbi:FkbM family methyltransferase [Pleurocapsales cyanobacterium LEGE 10410]|nr:FkbM family methyltransferase [Pleurocapsales cyanobacterium LEGE 10410]
MSIKSNVKHLITSNQAVSQLFYACFKEKIFINVKNQKIGYYMNPLFGRSLQGIDLNGEYEGPFLSRLVDDLLEFEEEICYLDIGGGYGLDIVVIDSFIKDKISYFTFEPDKFYQIYLKKNVSDIPVKIVEKFVGDRTAGNSIAIDDFCKAEQLEPTHIKIDIEGAEIYALKGMLDTIKKYQPRLYIEFHEVFIKERLKMNQSAIEEFFQILTEIGYKIEFNSHHYPLFSGSSQVYDYNWLEEKPNDMLYAVVCK